MKKILILLIVLSGLFVFQSCDEFETDPVIQYIGSPNLKVNASSSMLLSQEAADENAAELTWTKANFGYRAAINYTVELAVAGTNFANLLELSTSKVSMFNITIGKLNDALIMMELDPDVKTGLELRVKAFVSNNTQPQYSNVFAFDAIPYSVKLPPIYLLGGGTDPGWDNANALPAPYMSPGVYGIVAHLKADDAMKFIHTLGAWAPQWGTDADGTNTSGNLVYRPDEATADPASIPTPAVEGDYRVVADITNLTYVVYPIPDVVYLVGGATDAGWTPENGVPFTKDGVGKYSLTTNLSVGNGGMKIMASNSGAWAPQWGATEGAAAVFGKLVYRAGDADPDPPQIPEQSTAGSYKIEIDFTENTYKITKQ